MKRKKGFTLIELIMAVAILSIAITGIGTVFITSSATWRTGDIKLENVVHNQTLSQMLKISGKDYIKEIYDNTSKNSEGKAEFFIYFDGYEELKKAIDDNILTTLSSPESSSYALCKSKNSNNKKFGALVKISDVTDEMSNPEDPFYYKLYKLEIIVWNLTQPEGNGSSSTIYLGR